MSVINRAPINRYPPRRWRMRNGLMVPTSEAVAEALESIPDGSPWTWAALRVLPAIRGRRVQVIDDVELEEMGFRHLSSFPTLEMAPGIEVAFAIEVDVVWVTVDQQVVDRWDLTVEQVAVAAMGNLRRTVRSWNGTIYSDEYDGVPVHGLEGWPHWATSLTLLPEDLKCLFGSQDQLFIAPYACNLLSLPIDVDRDIAADLVDMFGMVNPRSLLLGVPAFVLRGGELFTEELPGFAEDPEDPPSTLIH